MLQILSKHATNTSLLQPAEGNRIKFLVIFSISVLFTKRRKIYRD